MKEGSNFDLTSLIESLVDLPQPYTQITLLTLTPDLLQFKVVKAVRSKHKKYKIMCTADQILSQARVLAKGMARFPVCKLVLPRSLAEALQPEHSLLQFQLLEVFSSITFTEILVEEPVRDLSYVFELIISKFRVIKLSFLFPLGLTIVARFISQVHLRLLSLNLIYCFQITDFNQKELLQFSESWISTLPFQERHQKPAQVRFGYPFSLAERRSNLIGRKQQVSIFYKNRQILTVRQLQQQGRFFILNEECTLTFLTQLIHLVFSSQKGVSFEIPALPSSHLIHIAQYVSSNFRKGFRINIGHQLQLAQNRMILNTIDLSEDEVSRLMNVGCKSGIHEIVMYSEHRYFQVALELFLKKPFIKFNFFMPLEQLTAEVQLLVKKIEAQCAITRINAYSFAGILKHHGERGYVVVNSIFCALAQHPC